MPEQSPSGFVPDLLLERYALGELPSAERARLARRLETDPALRARLEALRASDAALLAKLPPERFAHVLSERSRRERVEDSLRRESTRSSGAVPFAFAGSRWLRPVGVGALLMAVAAVPGWRILQGEGFVGTEVSELSEVPARSGLPDDGPSGAAIDAPAADDAGRPPEASAPPPRPVVPAPDPAPGPIAAAPAASGDGVRLKGKDHPAPALALFRKTRDGSEPLRPGAKVRPGDVLRIGYRTAAPSFGAIVSVDGRGNVTRHWPVEGDRAARLESGEHLLPVAFELDAAPDFERFFLLLSERDFPLRPVLESLHAAEPPDPATGIRAVRFDLLKDNGT